MIRLESELITITKVGRENTSCVQLFTSPCLNFQTKLGENKLLTGGLLHKVRPQLSAANSVSNSILQTVNNMTFQRGTEKVCCNQDDRHRRINYRKIIVPGQCLLYPVDLVPAVCSHKVARQSRGRSCFTCNSLIRFQRQCREAKESMGTFSNSILF